MQHEIVPLLFNIYIDCGWSTEKLLKDIHILEEMSNDLLQGTFVITKQTDCYIRKDEGNRLPVFTVRILSLSNVLQSIMVEAMLVPQIHIKTSFENEHEMLRLIKEKGKGVKISSNKVYLIHQRGAIFKQLKLMDLDNMKDRDGLKQGSDVDLYTVVFTASVANKTLWTLSQPIAALCSSESYQEILAYFSIYRQLFGTGLSNLPFMSQQRLPWAEFEGMLQLKFLRLSLNRPLSDSQLLHVKEILFGTADVSEVASLEEFLTTSDDSSSLIHNFWKWITDVCNLIESYLLDIWNEGLILGFLSMPNAELTLTKYQRAVHGTFILRFSDQNLRVVDKIEYSPVRLKAYVLAVQEFKVSLSNLETSKFRKLGKYLEETDAMQTVPKWQVLFQKCGLTPFENLQIANAVFPGVAFLEMLEKHLMISDLADLFKQDGMHDGLNILHAIEDQDSDSSMPYSKYRQIGSALELTFPLEFDEEIPCWKYIIHWDEKFSKLVKDETNIGKSSKPGEKFLDVFVDCGFKMSELYETCKGLGLQDITLSIECSSNNEAYLEETIVDVDIGGEKELAEKSLVDILKEKQNTDGKLLLRYLYPGNLTIHQLEEKYSH